MSFSPLIQSLVEAFRCLPGVGPKTAQRMAFHMLERDREGGIKLSETLQQAIENVGRCSRCRTLSEHELCEICDDSSRDSTKLCILETPVDVLAVEQTGGFNGHYFVLMGHLSPIDGIGPQDLGLDVLLEQIDGAGIEEIILATNPTVEGEATAHYIAEQVKDMGIKVTRIAHGVPVGGELEFVDGGTLAHALAGRRSLL
ncbi:recombination mediator RecR [Aliamphritea spongicola]|uniref:recombination mediator RecR n=1 Tax=Aliamphritea spongicola TaxID=707589 RepID=UPI00196AA30D|nr:recombination mediator RecR [Aliamphritea spongicola]MBN3563426.1 recombination protein RecR [Aliamphritea spongicola]